MSKYLLHQARDGRVVGVWLGEQSFYPEDSWFQGYGEASCLDRGTEEWDVFADRMAGGYPTPRAKWSTYESELTDLEEVFWETNSRLTRGD